MGWWPAFHPPPHAIETLVEQYAQAPPGTVTREAVEVVDMDIAIAVCVSLFLAVYFIQPIVGNYLTRGIVYQSGTGIGNIRVGVDTPVRLGDIFLDGLRTIDIGGVFVEAVDVLTLEFPRVPIQHEGA